MIRCNKSPPKQLPLPESFSKTPQTLKIVAEFQESPANPQIFLPLSAPQKNTRIHSNSNQDYFPLIFSENKNPSQKISNIILNSSRGNPQMTSPKKLGKSLREVDESMLSCLKKLALWYTKTFKPILTLEELEPIMATLGFVSLPAKPAVNGVVWKEYFYSGRSYRSLSAKLPPNTRLPSHRINSRHRIDGLHVYTYRAFIDAVKSSLARDDISDLFHIRGMPLERIDQCMYSKFRKMDEDDMFFVYKDGTLDPAKFNCDYYLNSSNVNSNTNNVQSSLAIVDKRNSLWDDRLVPLGDVGKSDGS